jgi:hypothetical protein
MNLSTYYHDSILLFTIKPFPWNRDSSVLIIVGYGLDDFRSNPGRGTNCSLQRHVKTGFRAHHTFYSLNSEASFRGG